MSEMMFPAQMGSTNDPPRGAPGNPNVQSAPDRAEISIRLRLADAYSIIASELKKQQPDPVQIVKAQQMLAQIMAMKPQQQQQPGPQQSPYQPHPFRNSGPRPVDGQSDAVTGQPITPRSTP
jgi:hypothetical protein